jgi:hypothetical protein
MPRLTNKKLFQRRAHIRFRFRRAEQVSRILVEWNRYIEKADHHLIPALLAKVDFLGGIGVRGIIGRVVVVRGAFDNRTGGQLLGLREVVGKLPAEAVVRDLENDFLGAVG